MTDLTPLDRAPASPSDCPTCGPTAAEPHPRLPDVARCGNCKTHVRRLTRRVVIAGNPCCGGNGVEASCEVCRRD